MHILPVSPSSCPLAHHPQQQCPHSPRALVVKEEDKEELLSSLGLFLLSQLQHIQWGNRDGDAIVQEALPGHLGIDDLEAEKGQHSARGGWGERGTLHHD